MNRDAKLAMCRLVGVLMLTDGHLTDAEHDHFYGFMEGLGLDDRDRSEVISGVQIDADLRPDVVLVHAAGNLEQLITALETASRIDGEGSASEADIIARVKAIGDTL